MALHLAPCPKRARPSFQIGGAPRLPDGLDWPLSADGRPMHYFAAVNLAELSPKPGEASQPALPKHPQVGTCFVFLNMFAHAVDTIDAAILYAPGPVEDLHPRDLPADLGPMSAESEYIGPITLSDCGRMFVQSDHLFSPAPATMRPAHATDKPTAQEQLPDIIDALINDPDKPLTKRGAFNLAKNVVKTCHAITSNELHHWHAQDVDARVVKKLETSLAGQKRKVEAVSITGTPTLWERFRYGSGTLPLLSGPLDEVFFDWMRYGRAHYRAKDMDLVLAPDERQWIKDAFERVNELGLSAAAPNLRCLSNMRNHDVTCEEVTDGMRDHFSEILDRPAATSACHSAGPASVDRAPELDQLPEIKMFGLSDTPEASDWDDGNHILLFQFAAAPGPSFLDIDTVMQIWILPDDLAKAQFGQIGVTVEMAY